MDLALIGKAVLALTAIGVLAAVMLSTASRRFHVEVDERVESVLAALPGANCGACGNPSCFGAAEAIVAGGSTLLGWVGNRLDPQMALAEENIATLAVRLPCPMLGVVPHLGQAAAEDAKFDLSPFVTEAEPRP